jgi:ribonuclease P protein subunit POP4
MKFKLKDIIKHELIGLQIKIAESRNKDNVGLSGKIINETKFTITIKTKKGKKMLFKNNIKIETRVNNKKIKIDGKLLAGRPEDRVKKV